MTARAPARGPARSPSEATGLGVFGGTFNPIHVGHLRAAEEVVEALGLDRMLFVPSARPPHKAAEGEDVIAPADQRLAWIRQAIADPRGDFVRKFIEYVAGPTDQGETAVEVVAHFQVDDYRGIHRFTVVALIDGLAVVVRPNGHGQLVHVVED